MAADDDMSVVARFDPEIVRRDLWRPLVPLLIFGLALAAVWLWMVTQIVQSGTARGLLYLIGATLIYSSFVAVLIGYLRGLSGRPLVFVKSGAMRYGLWPIFITMPANEGQSAWITGSGAHRSLVIETKNKGIVRFPLSLTAEPDHLVLQRTRAMLRLP